MDRAVGEGIEAAVPVAGVSADCTVVLGAVVVSRFENCVRVASVAAGAWGVVGLAAVR